MLISEKSYQNIDFFFSNDSDKFINGMDYKDSLQVAEEMGNTIICPYCRSISIQKTGSHYRKTDKKTIQNYQCNECHTGFSFNTIRKKVFSKRDIDTMRGLRRLGFSDYAVMQLMNYNYSLDCTNKEVEQNLRNVEEKKPKYFLERRFDIMWYRCKKIEDILRVDAMKLEGLLVQRGHLLDKKVLPIIAGLFKL